MLLGTFYKFDLRGRSIDDPNKTDKVKDMHSTETRGKLLELRSTGLSLARISGRMVHRFCTISSPGMGPATIGPNSQPGKLTGGIISKYVPKRSVLDRFRGTDRAGDKNSVRFQSILVGLPELTADSEDRTEAGAFGSVLIGQTAAFDVCDAGRRNNGVNILLANASAEIISLLSLRAWQ